jgi:transcription elongation factor Elf1|tara:strand:- start:2022 stop:2216 length:195 start_codon:yes stop_codon:yes gene_type:complete
MAKEKTVGSPKTVNARVHCPACKSRFVTKVEIIGPLKKDAKTGTKCKVCEANEKVSFLIFDRKY